MNSIFEGHRDQKFVGFWLALVEGRIYSFLLAGLDTKVTSAITVETEPFGDNETTQQGKVKIDQP